MGSMGKMGEDRREEEAIKIKLIKNKDKSHYSIDLSQSK